MTDGISEAHRAEREYREWDAPRCLICHTKLDAKHLEDHLMEHNVSSLVKTVADWSVIMWKNELK